MVAVAAVATLRKLKAAVRSTVAQVHFPNLVLLALSIKALSY